MYANEYISEFGDGGCALALGGAVKAYSQLKICKVIWRNNTPAVRKAVQTYSSQMKASKLIWNTHAPEAARIKQVSKLIWNTNACTDEFGINDGLQAPLEYTCPQEGCADEFYTREGLDTHLVADQGKEQYCCFWQDYKSPVTTTLRSHLAEHMRRDRNTRREAQIRREKQMKKEVQVKLEIQIMRAHIRRRCDARSKRGDDFNLVNLINSWKSEAQVQ